MNDMIINAAQDPSCILAVTPDRGGSWWAALRPGGNYPWPSSVPRNFVEEPETWYFFTPAYNSIGIDDFELDIVFDINACTQKNVFYDIAAKNGIGIYRGGTSSPYDFVIHAIHVITINEGEPFAGTAWRYNIGPEISDTISGKFHVKITRIGTTVSCYWNGNLVGKYTGSGIAPTNLTGSCVSNFDGSIQEVTLKNLTTGRTVWSYPSEAERVRLLTKTNVRTDRGAFEAADETKTARVDTALDLRGKISDYTVFVEFEAANMDENFSAQQLCGQGSATNMSLTEIAACMYYYRDSRYFIRHAWELGGKSVLFYTEVKKLTGRHQLASILQINETGAGSRAMMYLDGKLIHTADNDNSPSGVGSAEHFTIIEPANTTQTYSRKYGKIYSCLVFDRALTAAEIAALCPTSN